MKKNFRILKNYKKGDVILTEEPFAFSLKNEFHLERCDHCFKRSRLLKCSGCSFVHYCDRICQKSGWKYHKYECSNIKRMEPIIVPDSARMLARIIIKLNQGGGNEQSYYTEKNFRVFKDLMSHYNEIKKDEKRIEHFIVLRDALHKFLGDQILPNEAELLAIFGRMVVNTFNILDFEMQSIGTGLYLAASVIDHSCSPNALAVFDGTQIIIRTLKDLKSIDWMKVNISYIEQLNLPSVRQKELETMYYFLCQCKRCLDIEELNCMTATICQNEECKKCIKGGALETILKCIFCNQNISQETKEKIKEITQFTKEQISKMGHKAYLDICRVCLKKQEKLFHSSNIYKVMILDLAMDGCIDTQNWEDAFNYGEQIKDQLKKYYGDIHPLRGIFLMKMARMANIIGKPDEAIRYFDEAASVLSITHGPNHPFVREALCKGDQCYQ